MMDKTEEAATGSRSTLLLLACASWVSAVDELTARELEDELGQLRRSELARVVHALESVCGATNKIAEQLSEHVDQFGVGADDLAWAVDHLYNAGVRLYEVGADLDPKAAKAADA